jgi:hypothetical protein
MSHLPLPISPTLSTSLSPSLPTTLSTSLTPYLPLYLIHTILSVIHTGYLRDMYPYTCCACFSQSVHIIIVHIMIASAALATSMPCQNPVDSHINNYMKLLERRMNHSCWILLQTMLYYL